MSHAALRELTAHLATDQNKHVTARSLPAPRAPAALQTLAWLARPELALLESYGRRFGDAFRLDPLLPRCRADATRWPLVRVPTYVFAAPDDIRAVFSQPGDALTGGDAREFLEWYYGPDCVIALDGDPHLNERRLLRSVFDREFVARASDMVDAVATDYVRTLPSSGRASLLAVLDEVTVHANIALLFGSLPAPFVHRVHRFLSTTLNGIGWRAFPMAFPALRTDAGGWSPGGRHAARFADFRAVVAEEIGKRRAAPAGGDVLSRLLQHQSEDSPAQTEQQFMRVVGMLGAMDLSFAAVAWCAYHLLRNPRVLAQASAEATSGTQIGSRYVEAVCMEALRLNPPFPIAVRRVRQPVSINGLQLSPGAHVAVCMHLAHRRPSVYPDPDAFRPERFLERDYSPFEYLPFGGGARRCLGHSFAIGNIAAILTALLREFDVRPAGPVNDRVRRRAIAFVPRDPLVAEMRRMSTARSFASLGH